MRPRAKLAWMAQRRRFSASLLLVAVVALDANCSDTSSTSEHATSHSGSEEPLELDPYWEGEANATPNVGTVPPPAEKKRSCANFKPSVLANARLLEPIDERAAAATPGMLELTIDYDRADPSRMTLQAERFIEPMSARSAAADFIIPPDHASTTGEPEVQVIAADGMRRLGAIRQYHEYDTRVSLTVLVPMRQDTQTIRVVENGREVSAFQRPATATVEARVLQDSPQIIALLVRGPTTPIRLSFRDPRSKREYILHRVIYPSDAAKDHCWFVAVTPPKPARAPSASFQLHLLDVFERWTYSTEGLNHD